MQHYHYTNIAHGHGVTDNGHYHRLSIDTEGNYDLHLGDPTGSNYNSIAYRYTAESALYYAGRAYTGVTVKPLEEADGWKFSQGSVSDVNSTPRTETDTYGSVNPTAISLMPTYVGVYAWYRSA